MAAEISPQLLDHELLRIIVIIGGGEGLTLHDMLPGWALPVAAEPFEHEAVEY